MKKISTILAVLFTLAMPISTVLADGGFLNVTVMVSNDHGGQAKSSDFSYVVDYGVGSDKFSGNTQGYGFPAHNVGDNNSVIDYTVQPVAYNGYTLTTSDGCNNIQLDDKKFTLANCTVYAVDDQYVAPVAGSVAPQESKIDVPVTTSQKTNVTSSYDQIDQISQISALQEQLIALLNQLIAILTQELSNKQ